MGLSLTASSLVGWELAGVDFRNLHALLTADRLLALASWVRLHAGRFQGRTTLSSHWVISQWLTLPPPYVTYTHLSNWNSATLSALLCLHPRCRVHAPAPLPTVAQSYLSKPPLPSKLPPWRSPISLTAIMRVPWHLSERSIWTSPSLSLRGHYCSIMASPNTSIDAIP